MKISYIEYSPASNSLDLFICGCKPPHCTGCYNQELWDFNANGDTIENAVYDVVNLNHRFDSLIDRILILGGEPLDSYELYQEEFIKMLSDIKALVNKPIMLFTRYNLEDVPQNVKDYCDYIKCGRYIPELTTDNNIQEGIKLATSNQMIYKKGLHYD